MLRLSSSISFKSCSSYSKEGRSLSINRSSFCMDLVRESREVLWIGSLSLETSIMLALAIWFATVDLRFMGLVIM